MPSFSNPTAVLEGNAIRVRGGKASSSTIRAYLNPDLDTFLTVESLFDGFNQITTSKAQDSSSNTAFDLALSVVGANQPFTVKIVSSEGKGETLPVINPNPTPVGPIVVNPDSP